MARKRERELSRLTQLFPSKWFCARRFVSLFGVAINWLNGQRSSTFHFIRDNGLCAEGRTGELLLEKGVENRRGEKGREEEQRG